MILIPRPLHGSEVYVTVKIWGHSRARGSACNIWKTDKSKKNTERDTKLNILTLIEYEGCLETQDWKLEWLLRVVVESRATHLHPPQRNSPDVLESMLAEVFQPPIGFFGIPYPECLGTRLGKYDGRQQTLAQKGASRARQSGFPYSRAYGNISTKLVNLANHFSPMQPIHLVVLGVAWRRSWSLGTILESQYRWRDSDHG